MNTLTHRSRAQSGSILVAAILAVTVLAALVGLMLNNLVQRHNLTFQTAAWQESRMASEAGIEVAMQALHGTPEDALSSTLWDVWSGTDQTGATALSYASAGQNNGIASGSGLRASSDALYLDNQTLPIDNDAGRTAVYDVEVRALYPDEGREDEVWFRIRSLGTSGVQGHRKWAAPYAEDTRLRTINVQNFNFNSGGTGPDYGTSQADVVPPPCASRLVEVIARPVRAFSVAILTDEWMVFGNSNNYLIDSYNSDDGAYQEADRNENGDIASNGVSLASNLYEIILNKTSIYGDVNANDFDINGNIPVDDHSGSYDRVTGEVTTGFYMEIPTPTVPSAMGISAPGDVADIPPGSWTVSGDLGPFVVSTPGKVEVHVTGDWITGSGNKSTVEIHPDAEVEIYVDGNIDFGNGDINVVYDDGSGRSDVGTPGVPGNLKIYGTGTSGTLQMSGNPNVSAAIYVPDYVIEYKGGGNGNFYGAVVAKQWDMSGGGNAGFHYDEKLAEEGTILGYRIHSYIEDWRRQTPPKKS